MRRIYNFSAGPAVHPLPVLEEASQAILEINGSGMSLLEVSHRSKDYDAIHVEAMANVLGTLGLSADEYAVCFLGGGASLQFAMLPMNFLAPGQTADYLDAGEWGSKAIAEARRVGTVNVAGSSADTKYDRIPRTLALSPPGAARYLHFTTNNTIEGTQVFALPETNGAPLTADMSSDIFAVDRDHSRFDLLYAGAQKNAGPAGVTMIVIRRSFLETAHKNLSPMLSYAVQAQKDSLYNTPPVFPIFVVNLTLKWIAAQGGLAAIEKNNREKAALIYDALDATPDFYQTCAAEPSDRSLMNITFRLADESHNAAFLAEAKKRDMDGLPGHRNVGGFRASVYNAFPAEGCQALADLLTEFARQNG
ncbi:MAG: 3-phosphoserine/phosphohydroxythreonine transaminase [Cytophagales bacterium]|nr:3-phosphoserine/phosphohydroxythreonine transaminase [Armatimonadota bacterium]